MSRIPDESIEGLFDALGAMRELAESIAASAKAFRRDLEADGWSPTLAENMAAMLYATTMSSISASMTNYVKEEGK